MLPLVVIISRTFTVRHTSRDVINYVISRAQWAARGIPIKMSVLSQSGGRSADFQALVNHFKNSAEPPLEETKKCAKNCLNLTEYEKIPFANIIQENRVSECVLNTSNIYFPPFVRYMKMTW